MSARKFYCGMYKGLKIYQEGQFIGPNWYGTYYAAKKKNERYFKIKDSESKTLEELSQKIKDNKWGTPKGT